MTLKSINPFNGKVIREFDEITDKEVEEILSQSVEAYEKWKKTGFEQRRDLLEKTSLLLIENKEGLAKTITEEMGKPIKESVAEVEKCATVCRYYAENGKRFLSSETVQSDAYKSYVVYEPLGTILGIMPWNFPFWQVFRFAVPTLMAGNTVLLKHASNVQICAEKIADIFAGAGFPPAVFRNLVVGSARIGKIIRHKSVKALSLTGSEQSGEKVAEVAGRSLKKCVLELGGSNAFVVLGDADLGKAVETGIKARFQNAGQSCIAAKRFITDAGISNEFISQFVEGVGKMKTGNPLKDETDMGPLASIEQALKVEEQVRKSVAMGAKIIIGGLRQKSFFQPTVVSGVIPGMPLFDEEVFGPVAPVTVAPDTGEAITLARQTKFGLGVSLFTNDLEKAGELVSEFPDGAVFINGLVKSDPRLPFGGTGRSGFGRELGMQGIREFVNVKTVWIAKL